MRLKEFVKFSRKKNRYWLKRTTVKFFNTKIYHYKKSTGLFISSEENLNGTPGYSVRRACFLSGQVETLGNFRQYKSLDDARKAMLKYV